ncbi:MAG: hypothetical protein QM503_15490, partial [Bacteroidota bacterium]
MSDNIIIEKRALTVRALTIVKKILDENHDIKNIFTSVNSYEEALTKLKHWLSGLLNSHKVAKDYYHS